MGSRSSLVDILAFLHLAKQLISDRKYDFVPRRKNMQALAKFGLTIQDIKDEITNMVVSDYYSGPKPDKSPDKEGDVWEFKRKVFGKVFYIKLKIVQENGEYLLKCLSFHDDDFD